MERTFGELIIRLLLLLGVQPSIAQELDLSQGQEEDSDHKQHAEHDRYSAPNCVEVKAVTVVRNRRFRRLRRCLNKQQKQRYSDLTLSTLKVQAYSLMPRDDSQLRHFRLGSEQFRSCHKRCPCECNDRWRIRKLSPDHRVRLKTASKIPKFHGVWRLEDNWSI